MTTETRDPFEHTGGLLYALLIYTMLPSILPSIYR